MNQDRVVEQDVADEENERKTNVQIISEIMTFSRFGGLSQVFVIEAVTKYAAEMAALTDEQVAQPGGMVHLPSWRGVAQEIKAKLDAFYAK